MLVMAYMNGNDSTSQSTMKDSMACLCSMTCVQTRFLPVGFRSRATVLREPGGHCPVTGLTHEVSLSYCLHLTFCLTTVKSNFLVPNGEKNALVHSYKHISRHKPSLVNFLKSVQNSINSQYFVLLV